MPVPESSWLTDAGRAGERGLSGRGASLTWMFEVYYLPPTDPSREARIAEIVTACNGRLDYKEAPELDGNHNVCLTYEFESLPDAEKAMTELQAKGEYVEGPQQYS